MILAEFDHLDASERAEVSRFRRGTRINTIMGAPEAEAEERRLIAFALVLRLDLSPDAAVLFLRQAPTLRTVDEVSAWVGAIPRQPSPEARH